MLLRKPFTPSVRPSNEGRPLISTGRQFPTAGHNILAIPKSESDLLEFLTYRESGSGRAHSLTAIYPRLHQGAWLAEVRGKAMQQPPRVGEAWPPLLVGRMVYAGRR